MGVVRVDGTRLYYRTLGSGPPLVMLHGLGGTHQDWEYQMPVFAQHFEVIALDFRGHGGSDRSGHYSVPQFAADTWQVLDELKIRRFNLLGYSMGGAVALQMALEAPARIERLVLSNTLSSFRTDTLGKRILLWTRLFMMGFLGPRRLAEVMTKRVFPRPEQADLRERVAKRNAQNDKIVYLHSIRALTEWSVADRVGELKMPVLVLAAEHDFVPRVDTDAFVRALRDARFELFPGTRHGLPQEMPDDFNRAVLDFLRPAIAPAPRAASARPAAQGS
jgi:pimeloyl-ACP methyl ester carboxylesterase